MRFLGRKVYLGAVVVLVAAMRQGPSPRRVRELSELFGADRHTIARWQIFWREHFPGPRSGRWHAVACVRAGHCRSSTGTCWKRSSTARIPEKTWQRLLEFLSPITITRGPGDQGNFLKDSGPQKMLVEHSGGAGYIWSHCRFHLRVLDS